MATAWGASAPLTLLAAVLLGLYPSAALPSDASLGARLHMSPALRHGLLQAGPTSATRSMAEAEALPEPAPTLVVHPARSSWWPASFFVAAAPAPAPASVPAAAPLPASVVEVDEKEEKEDIKEVKHYKHPGGLYKKGSPMYEKQQAILAKQQVSMTMKCIIFMTVQFFIVYTTLFITQTVNRVRPTTLPRLERCLMCVAKTLYFIPMLCVLFLATRMRAVQLTQGMTDQYDLPQWWVRQAMLACSVAVCLQTVLAAIYYALLSKDPDAVKGSNPSRVEKALNYSRWLIIVCLYLGFMIVCVGVCIMPAPEEIWGEGGGPKVSPAVFCTIFLTTLYFAVHFCIEFVKTVDECLTPEGKRFGVLAPQTLFLRDAAATVDIAPMLCILFLAARLRALQLNPKTGNPPSWAQTFFYISSFSILGLVLLCVLSAYLLQKEGFFAAGQEEPSPEARPSGKVKAAEFLRSVFMFVLYLGAINVILSMFLQKRDPEDGPTPVIPPSIKCVMILTTVYFVVYALLWVTTTAKKLRMPAAANRFMTNLANFLEKKAEEAIKFAPMLCILFLGTFMRALQITAGKGAPQRWAQTFMYIGTMAVVLMTVARLDLLMFPPVPEGTKPEGAKPSVSRVAAFFFVLQHLSLFLMHIAAVAVIIALFTMTPETAKGTGAIMSVL